MSQKLVGRSPALKRLRDEGYDVQVVGTHLIIRDVPYVTAAREIKRGFLVSILEFDVAAAVKKPDDHTVWFGGESPCNKHGQPLEAIIIDRTRQSLTQDVVIDFRFSSKPWDGIGYPDYFEKMVTYIKMLTHEAQAIDPSVTAKTYPPILNDTDDDSPFQYFDTSSSRSGTEALAYKLALKNVAIVGLGGTGSYILDLVAKTRVAKIHLYDDDNFSLHNAFRCPGAVGFGEFAPNLKKVSHYERVYTKLHKGITPHPYKITAENASELSEMQFVFLCLDSGEHKDSIMGSLEKAGVPFIDVGMGLQLVNDAICGILRSTTSVPNKRDHIRSKNRISFAPAAGPNDYSRNIQVADLNALNATIAVMKWKKLFGVYHDLNKEHHTTYVLETNRLGNEDQ